MFSDVIRDSDRGSFFAQLAPCMQPRRGAKGDTLIRQGETNDDLYFLLQVIAARLPCDHHVVAM